ncbi:alpha/beta fold hydrolase [Streptomyces albiaxialis]|uniref:Alpha/beta fold hydrolase n=1 Tax=Streptomyces albiaxialis TaxID=329523 RepID=A0ABP5H1H5_9ACTN
MRHRAGCDVARSPLESVTESDGGGAIRAVLRTTDGVRIEARYEPRAAREAPGAPGSAPGPGPGSAPDSGPGSLAVVLAHGFTGSLDRPALRRAAAAFRQYAAVITFSFRGHGRSGGRSTVGDREVLDLAAAVGWARALGHSRVATVGFSMGGSVVVRHAALYRPEGADGYGESVEGAPEHGGRTGARTPSNTTATATATGTGAAATGIAGEAADAAVAVSAPARWYYNGTAPMRRLHWAVQRPLGRLVARHALRTRIHPEDWDPVPLPPVAAAPLIAPTPLLVVHGDRDPYFPLDHPRSLAEAAGPETAELWLVPGFGHAENAAEPALLDRVGAWILSTGAPAARARRHHGTRKAADG